MRRAATYQGTPCSKCGGTERYTSARKCVPCNAVKQRTWRRDNPGSSRTYELKRKYGLSPEDYALMSLAQDGKCAICKDEPLGMLCIDHDHVTGEVRDLLCHACNTSLGKMKDDPAILRAAAAYLERHHARRTAPDQEAA